MVASHLNFLHFDYVLDRFELGKFVGDENVAGKTANFGHEISAMLSGSFFYENSVALQQSPNGIRVAVIDALHRTVLRESCGH